MDDLGNITEVMIPVRYSETDAMKFVYYAHFFVYFEVARTTGLADLGFPYSQMEEDGVLIPVLKAACEYKRPGRYGDTLRIRTTRWRLGRTRIRFEYVVSKEKGPEEIIALGSTEHAFMNTSGKILRPPENLIALFPERS